jgi:hypothetical protein
MAVNMAVNMGMAVNIDITLAIIGLGVPSR